jgi:dTDP-4-dehydrorhamnose reductase
MNILLTGSKGQLGRALLRAVSNNFTLLPLDLPELNITDQEQLSKVFFSFGPSIVINAAAYTNVDQAETEKRLAFAANRDGPANLATLCQKMQIPLIHVSTDFVFDGRKQTPYREEDQPNPISVYGQSKADGEAAIRSCLKRHIIIRTAWLYSQDGHNFVKTMLRLGKEKGTIAVVADQYGSPTSAADLAQAIWMMINRFVDKGELAWGIYHFCGSGKTTWHGFAQTILEIAARCGKIKTVRVKPIATAEYPTPAARPTYSVLDCSLISQRFGIMPPPWQESLARTVAEIMQQERRMASSSK